jgi:TMEM175 potassium channel family protein
MPDTVQRPEAEAAETFVEMGRLNGLSDGVFAIALTLLVLGIGIPEGVLESDLPVRLLELGPKLFVYLISFVVIGGAWGSHQRMLSQIRRGDGVLVWLNLLSLLFVTLMPAAAVLLGRLPNSILAILVFAVVVILIQLSALLLWRRASQHGLINPELDPRVVQGVGRRLSLAAIAFAVSIPLAFINPILVYAVWVALFLLILSTDWLSWRQSFRTRDESVPLEDAGQGRLRILYSYGILNVRSGATGHEFVGGRFGGGVETKVQRDNNVVDVEFKFPEKQGLMSFRYPWAWGNANVRDWNLRLGNQVPTSLWVEASSCKMNIDLNDLHVTELDVKTGASSTNIVLPSAGQTAVKIEGSNTAFFVSIPPGVAGRIHAAEPIGGAEIDLVRFPMIIPNREYCSPDFETAANRADLNVSLPLGAIEVH